MGIQSKHVGFDAGKAKEAEAKKIEGRKSKNSSADRLKIVDGYQAWWLMPALEGQKPWACKQVHYKPFHMCGRDHPVPNPDFDPEQEEHKKNNPVYVEDTWFANCTRCMQAWDNWSETDKAPGQPKDDFKANMPSKQLALQVIDFTPFFEPPPGRATKCSVNEDLVDRWMDEFVEIVCAVGRGESPTPPKDMPEEMAKSALYGPTIVLVSDYMIRKILEDEFYEYYYDRGSDPTLEPEKTILQIKRSSQSRGQGLPPKTDYSLKYLRLDDWGFPEDELFGLFGELVESGEYRNIHDLNRPDKEYASLEEKVYDYQDLTDAEIEQWLEKSGHSFTSEDVDEVPEKGEEMDASDPSQFRKAESVLASKADVSKLRDELEDD